MAYLNVFINNSNKKPINVSRDTKPVPPGPDIDKWVKEHMVFWYDMSKPVDTYIPSVTYANQFINDGFTEQELIDYVLENIITQ